LAQQRARVDIHLGVYGRAQGAPNQGGGDAKKTKGVGRHGAGKRVFQPELLKIRQIFYYRKLQNITL
jgi:hypothetical protein